MQKNLWGFRENTAFQRSKHGHISPDLQASNAIIYLWTGYESDSKFTVSRDVKFDPRREIWREASSILLYRTTQKYSK